MQKKESYKHILPHFQQPGQAYFVTWCLKDAIPAKVVSKYSAKLDLLKHQIDFHQNRVRGFSTSEFPAANKNRKSQYGDQKFSTSGQTVDDNIKVLKHFKIEYYSIRKEYFKAFDKYLDAEATFKINLVNPENLKVMQEALNFWNNRKIRNEAFCVMPNHVHWVFQCLEKDEDGKPVYLQDIMHSVKRFSANRINKLENREGAIWQKESFDTTIRDQKHLYNVVEYTINNPVSAGLAKNKLDWPGTEIGIGSF